MTENAIEIPKGYRWTTLGGLPEEWEIAKLGDVSQKRNEPTLPSKDGKFRYVGLEHIDPGELRIKRFGYDNQVRSSKNRFYHGDILYGKLRPYLDKCVQSDFEGICSTDIIVITASEKIDGYFLVDLMHLKSFVQNATKTMTGVNHPRTSWQAISQFFIPIPPLQEQKAIANVLQTIQEAKEKTEEVIRATKELKKSMMKHLFTYGPVPPEEAERVKLKETEIGMMPEDWGKEIVKNLVEKTGQIDPRKKPNWRFRYVDVSGVNRETLRIQESQEIRGEDAPSRARKLMKKSDVIFATVRPTLKRLAFVNDDYDGQVCSTAFCVLRAKKEVLAPPYLFFALQRDIIIADLGRI